MRNLVCAVLLSIAGPLCAQTVNVWPGVAPERRTGHRKSKTFTGTPVGTVVINVVTPTVTAYLPASPPTNRTAVIIAPGDAFVALAIDLEANALARSLRSKGIAAFVLKYRTIEKKSEGIPPMLDMDQAGRYGIADGIQARDFGCELIMEGIETVAIAEMAAHIGIKYGQGFLFARPTLIQPHA